MKTVKLLALPLMAYLLTHAYGQSQSTLPKTATPSLKETLDWLKDKLDTHASNPITNKEGKVLGTWFKPIRFNGCEVVWREEMYSDSGSIVGEHIVNLGDLDPSGAKIENDPLMGFYYIDLNTPNGKSLIKHRSLMGEKEILVFSDNTVRLRVKDQDMAKRIDKAFMHAIKLCIDEQEKNRAKSKEPF